MVHHREYQPPPRHHLNRNHLSRSPKSYILDQKTYSIHCSICMCSSRHTHPLVDNKWSLHFPGHFRSPILSQHYRHHRGPGGRAGHQRQRELRGSCEFCPERGLRPTAALAASFEGDFGIDPSAFLKSAIARELKDVDQNWSSCGLILFKFKREKGRGIHEAEGGSLKQV